jgi:hypothetical protein
MCCLPHILQDITVVGTLPDGTPLTFKHPAVQSACMFFGESLCLIPYFYMRWRKRKAKRRNPAYVPMHPGDAPGVAVDTLTLQQLHGI